MTPTELIVAALRGERVATELSLYPLELNTAAQCYHPLMRTIVCDGTHDVVECADCGAQRVTRCHFDEEYS